MRTCARFLAVGNLVLVVDENDRERRYIGALLAADGFDIIQVSDSVAGMVKVTTFEPSLIILAAEGGPVPFSQLVGIFRRISQAPLIVVGDSEPPDEVESMASGADLVLPKTFGAAELISRSRMLIRRGGEISASVTESNASPLAVVGLPHTILEALLILRPSRGRAAA